MSKQRYEWFLEPLDAESNEIISREVSEENLCREISCNDGKRRTLWRCSFNIIKFFWESRGSGIDIKIYNRTINSGTSRGKAKDVTFLLRHQFLTKSKIKKTKK
jgi:hypothetical protein